MNIDENERPEIHKRYLKMEMRVQSLNRSRTAAPLRSRYFRYEEEFHVAFAGSYQLQGELNEERYRHREVGM